PQGAEYQAVRRGCRCGDVNAQNAQTVAVVSIPVGSRALYDRLVTLSQTDVLQKANGVIVMGLCGSLAADYRLGDVVVYRACLSPSPITDSGNHLPTLQGYTVKFCELTLTQKLMDAFGADPLLRARLVTAFTSDRLLWAAAEKRQLGQTLAADVVDMEGAIVVSVLAAIGVPVAMVRVVSDGVEQDLPNITSALGRDGAIHPLPLALAMLQQPIASLHLIHSSLAALHKLQAAATVVATVVSAPHHPNNSRDRRHP
ncbi:MAG: hypothetical protein NZ772_18770, partial [Cyanobacteria bacterium]|nr:hypothetical protein [Cyanobacteriota bacterium]MDW8202707.1 hypothetical protein [Cyanobacteriota bacterium SKYGB_h_bin112]